MSTTNDAAADADHIADADMDDTNASTDDGGDAGSELSDAEEDDEQFGNEELLHRVNTLQVDIAMNPYSPADKYSELITLLQQAVADSAVEQSVLNDVRAAMQSKYALSVEQWLQWLQDAQSKLSAHSTPADTQHVLSLYELALADHDNMQLLAMYGHFNEVLHWQDFTAVDDQTLHSIATIREQYDKCLNIAKYHIEAQSDEVFNAARAFELRLSEALMSLDTASDEQKMQQQLDMLTAQNQRIESLYRLQLAYPHLTLQQTHAEYVEWCSGAEVLRSAEVEQAYVAALKKLESVRQHEDQLTATQANLDQQLLHWQQYIATMQQQLAADSSSDAVHQVTALYDRCLNVLPQQVNLWSRYNQLIAYYQAHYDNHRRLAIGKRAYRNNPTDLQLINTYLNCSELAGQLTTAHIDSILELLTGQSVPLSDGFITVYLLAAAFARRANNVAYAIKQLQACVAQLGYHQHTVSTISADEYAKVFRLWLSMCSTNDERQSVYTQWLQLRQTVDVNVWQDYIAFSTAHSSPENVRNLYQHALMTLHHRHAEGWKLALLCNAWMQYELETGSIEQYYHANQVTHSYLQGIEAAKQARQVTKAPPESASNNKPTKAAKSRQKREVAVTEIAEHGKRGRDALDSTKSTSRSQPQRKQTRTTDDAPTAAGKPQHPPPASADGTSKSIAAEPHTVFMLNLPFDVRTETLRQMCQEYGTVVDVVNNKRGYAWVQYDREQSMQAAIRGQNGKQLNDRPIQVRKSDPHAKRSTQQSAHAHDVVNRTIYIKRIPLLVDDIEDVLRSAFAACGEIVNVRLHRNKQNKYANYCFIEYASADSVQKAVLLYDDKKLLPDTHPRGVGQHPMAVTPAEDRSKAAQKEASPSAMAVDSKPAVTSSTATTKRAGVLTLQPASTMRPRIHPRASAAPTQRLQPASSPSSKAVVHTNGTSNGAMDVDSSQPVRNGSSGAPLSNDDFRKMFQNGHPKS